MSKCVFFTSEQFSLLFSSILSRSLCHTHAQPPSVGRISLGFGFASLSASTVVLCFPTKNKSKKSLCAFFGPSFVSAHWTKSANRSLRHKRRFASHLRLSLCRRISESLSSLVYELDFARFLFAELIHELKFFTIHKFPSILSTLSLLYRFSFSLLSTECAMRRQMIFGDVHFSRISFFVYRSASEVYSV